MCWRWRPEAAACSTSRSWASRCSPRRPPARCRDVAGRYGGSPIGPWGSAIPVYHAPEPDIDPANVYTYNAKGHPHLSRPGEMLISYNVNTFDFNENINNADIYRPRFIRLPLQ